MNHAWRTEFGLKLKEKKKFAGEVFFQNWACKNLLSTVLILKIQFIKHSLSLKLFILTCQYYTLPMAELNLSNVELNYTDYGFMVFYGLYGEREVLRAVVRLDGLWDDKQWPLRHHLHSISVIITDTKTNGENKSHVARRLLLSIPSTLYHNNTIEGTTPGLHRVMERVDTDYRPQRTRQRLPMQLQVHSNRLKGSAHIKDKPSVPLKV